MGDIESAWAAGLFEGEGSIGIYNGRVKLQLQTSDRDIAERFYKFTGVSGKGPSRRENVYSDGIKRKPTWAVQIHRAADVVSALQRMYPYLGERRKQKADEVIAAGLVLMKS